MPRPIGYKFCIIKMPQWLKKAPHKCQTDNLNSVAMRSEGVRRAYLNKKVTPA